VELDLEALLVCQWKERSLQLFERLVGSKTEFLFGERVGHRASVMV
jgi:hypothetical protein